MLVQLDKALFPRTPLMTQHHYPGAVSREFFQGGNGTANSLNASDTTLAVNRGVYARPHKYRLTAKGLAAKDLLVLGIIRDGRHIFQAAIPHNTADNVVNG